MGVAVPRAPVVTRSPEPPQKFGHGPSLLVNQVSQNNQGEPPPLNQIFFVFKSNILYEYHGIVNFREEESREWMAGGSGCSWKGRGRYHREATCRGV